MGLERKKRVRTQPAGPASAGNNSVTAGNAIQRGLVAPTVARRLAEVFRSMSDPTRLRIISLLSEREYCVTDLVAELGMEQSTISHQLRDMRKVGWVRSRREGRYVFYVLDDEHVRYLYRQALAHIGQR